MVAIINDPDLLRTMLRRRRALGHDKYDEVWDGVYVMNAMPNNDHQKLVNRLCFALESCIGDVGLGLVQPGANVSDQWDHWKKNYRCPDVVVFLNGNTAVDRETHWCGGPDFAVEVVSPRDRSRKKLPFYANVGTREVLFVDRRPWQLELYRLGNGGMELAASVTSESEGELISETVPLRFSLRPGNPRPMLVMTHQVNGRTWTA